MNVPEVRFYVVQNKDGQYFRARGFGGSGQSWVNDINDAKFYTKIRQARSRVTFFAKNYPNYGIPNIVEIIATQFTVLNEEKQRAEKAVQKALDAKKNEELRAVKRTLEWAEREYETAKQRLTDKKAALAQKIEESKK